MENKLGGSMQQKQLLITAVLVLVVGVLAFAGGMYFQKSRQSMFNRQWAADGKFGSGTVSFSQGGPGGGNVAFGQMGGGRGTGGAAGGANGSVRTMGIRPVDGEIIATNDQSITVKLADGSSKIVVLSANATINKAAVATKADLTVGQKVAVFGQANADGSVTAQSIQLNPLLRMMGANASPSANPSK
jgi:hypothetical protein